MSEPSLCSLFAVEAEELSVLVCAFLALILSANLRTRF